MNKADKMARGTGTPLGARRGSKGRSFVPMLALVSFLLAATVALSACGPASTDTGAAPEAAAGQAVVLTGEQLLEARCTTCHTTDRITREDNSSSQWETVVTEMVSKGAELTDEEKAVLVEYLAATYGP